MPKYHLSTWVYNPVEEFTPDEVDLWADCGLTVPVAPRLEIGKNRPEELIPFLDRAQELGIKLIGNFAGLDYNAYRALGQDGYEKRMKSVIDAVGDHPALYGIDVGDEPNSPEDIEASRRCIETEKRLAPHLTPYLCYTGNSRTFGSERFGGRDLKGWLKYVRETTGTDEVYFDVYDQAVNDGGGKTSYFACVRDWVEAADYAGCEARGVLLSSAHLVFRQQREVDLLWQLNSAAAMGLRGVQWFRFYDRERVITYSGSPVDEFGNKTKLYYGMMRVQRRFNNHYGELFMRLRHKKTYEVKSDRGVFPEFRPGDHELIKSIEPNDETMVSFFEDEDGTEYMVLFHTVTKYYGVVNVRFDDTKCDLYKITNNGAEESRCRNHDGEDEGNTILPASIAMYKIVRK